MSHLRFFGLDNFKVFNKETDFELKPITLLTGTNSSGKSSIIRGLQLMKALFVEGNGSPNISLKNIDFLNNLDFQKVHNLGGFDIVRNKNNSDEIISFRLPFMLPNQLNQMVLQLNYKSDGSRLKNAIIENIFVYDKKTNELLYDIKWDVNMGFLYDFNVEELLKYLFDCIDKYKKYELIKKTIKFDKSIHDKMYKGKVIEDDNYKKILPQLISEYAEFIMSDNKNNYEFKSEILHRIYDSLIINNTIGSSFNKKFLIKDIYSEYIFDFLFLYKKQYIEKYVEAFLNEEDKLNLYNLLTNIENMNAYEKVNFIEEYKDFEINLLEFVVKYNYINEVGLKDYIDINALLDIEYHDKLFNQDEDGRLNRVTSFIENSKFSKKYKINSNLLINNVGNKSLLYHFDNIDKEATSIIRNYVSSEKKIIDEFCIGGILKSTEDLIISFYNTSFIPSIRSIQSRSFSSVNSSYIVEVLNEFHRTTINEQAYQFLKKYIKEFKIADEIVISFDEDTNTSKVTFIKNNQKYNLADLGYGVSQLLPILLKIAINISKSHIHYGMTEEQVYTGDINSYEAYDFIESSIVIEEPEANLHPALQSKLADMFVDCYKTYNIQFIIETHSEYLIRKMQYLIAKGDFQSNRANIYYFNDPNSEEYKTEVVYKIDIEKNGILSRPFGTGFFDESNNLNMSLFLLTKDSLN